MTILRLIRGPASRADYDAVIEAVKLATRHPLGLIMHGATDIDGGIQLAEVWENEEYARRFDEEIFPTLKELGTPRATEVMVFELHQLVTP
jgi:hypothetical protein